MSDGPYDPVQIGRVLDDQSKRFGMGEAKQVGTLFSAWDRIVGPAVSAHVEPTSLRNGVLKLRADSPTWATEIGYLREDIRAKANEALGGEVVTKIDVAAGPRKGPPVTRHRDRKARPGTGMGAEEGARDRPPADDPLTALERAREAWLKRRGKRS